MSKYDMNILTALIQLDEIVNCPHVSASNRLRAVRARNMVLRSNPEFKNKEGCQ